MTTAEAHFAFDGERTVRNLECAECGDSYRRITGFILRHDEAFVAYFASLHQHRGAKEAWIDAIFGTWGEGIVDDHCTFGCRFGPVVGRDEPAATLVNAAIPFRDSPLFGRKLTRAEGLTHPKLGDYWDVVDFILLDDPDVHSHVYD